MFTVLFAEDEDGLRETVCEYLKAKGMTAIGARNGCEAVDAFYDNSPDIIILDVMMPVMNGFDVCKIIRRRDKTVPVVFLTAMGQESDFLRGYNCGCDDYITKPFPLSVLYEKCMTLIKRTKGIDSGGSITLGGVRLDYGARKVFCNGASVRLADKDFRLLSYLMENKNIVLSRELILTHIWGYDFEGETRVVDTHIKILRRALGEYGSMIKTVVSVGYSFQCD